MGIGKFQLPTKSIPLNRSTKNSAQLITSARGPPIPNLVEIHPLGLLGKWVKYIFFYLYLFSLISLQVTVRPVDGFLRTVAQKTWNHARMCLLWVWTMFPQILGYNFPKTEIFWAWIRLSSLNDKKIKILTTWKLLSRSWRNFYRKYAPWMGLRGWSHGSPNQIQDGGSRHL